MRCTLVSTCTWVCLILGWWCDILQNYVQRIQESTIRRSYFLHTVKQHSLQLTERLKGSLRENLHALMNRKLRHWRFHAFHFHFIILSGALKRDSNFFHALRMQA